MAKKKDEYDPVKHTKGAGDEPPPTWQPGGKTTQQQEPSDAE